MQRTYSSSDVKVKIFQTLGDLVTSNKDFEEAYTTYLQQYGNDKIGFSDPLNLAGTVDPVHLIIGRNCDALYLDSSKTVRGSRGALELKVGDVCIIGRREPQDSVLVVWNSRGDEVELEEYNSRASIIPSRIHCSITYLTEEEMLFSDLGSSSGTTVIGDRSRGGPFVKIYDPGTGISPAIKFERISTSKILTEKRN